MGVEFKKGVDKLKEVQAARKVLTKEEFDDIFFRSEVLFDSQHIQKQEEKMKKEQESQSVTKPIVILNPEIWNQNVFEKPKEPQFIDYSTKFGEQLIDGFGDLEEFLESDKESEEV